MCKIKMLDSHKQALICYLVLYCGNIFRIRHNWKHSLKRPGTRKIIYSIISAIHFKSTKQRRDQTGVKIRHWYFFSFTWLAFWCNSALEKRLMKGRRAHCSMQVVNTWPKRKLNCLLSKPNQTSFGPNDKWQKLIFISKIIN